MFDLVVDLLLSWVVHCSSLRCIELPFEARPDHLASGVVDVHPAVRIVGARSSGERVPGF